MDENYNCGRTNKQYVKKCLQVEERFALDKANKTVRNEEGREGEMKLNADSSITL